MNYRNLRIAACPLDRSVIAFSDMSKILVAIALIVPSLSGQSITALSLDQQEQFLRVAVVKQIHGAKKGITGTKRATLSDGTMTHDASIQTIDEERSKYETPRGTEMNFRDFYGFNIAGYRLGRTLGLDSMIPPSIERKFEGKSGAWTWWIDDVQMDEGERLKRKVEAPDKDRWSRQYLIMSVFDQLIYNTDRNATNYLYDKDWNFWIFDHSRAFRTHTQVMEKKALDRCDRQLLKRMKELQAADVKRELGRWLRPGELRGLMARRDAIVAYFEAASPAKLYDFLPAR